MRIKRAFNTGKNSLLKKIMTMSVFAEEQPTQGEDKPNNDTPSGNTTPTVNFEDLIANARKQEKEKLYPQIKKLEEDKRVLTEKNNAHLLTIGQKDAKIQELEKQIATNDSNNSKEESEVVSSLKNEIGTLKKTIADMESTNVSRETIESEIRAEYEVKLYREQKLREVGDSVIPELITGNSKEEIDASLEISKQRYTQITERVLGGVKVPVANVNTSSFSQKDLRVEDITSLDPRSPEYAQLRAKLGLK